VQQNGTSAFVYLVNPDNKVSVQSVTVLANDDLNTAVQGLNPNVNVATSGFDRLENGVQVAVRGAAGASGASGGSGARGSGGRAVNQPGRQGNSTGMVTSPAGH
jgi:multidrug efflux system membrane fusion protein